MMMLNPFERNRTKMAVLITGTIISEELNYFPDKGPSVTSLTHIMYLDRFLPGGTVNSVFQTFFIQKC